LFQEVVTGYRAEIGLCYGFNVAFRKANTYLKGTEYEKVPWMEKEGEDSLCVIMEKQINDETVTLTITFQR